MARTKQTARKNTGGKPLAMGRGKATPKKNPNPGRSVDRKVVLEYSSDETPDESTPRPVEGAEAPKHVKKQIHLTLPTSPAHVTTTESFTAFFINHGLTRALQKAFAKRGWSTDQMGSSSPTSRGSMDRKSPCPKSTGTKIHRTATILSWQTGPKQPRRPRVVQEAPAGASHVRSLQPVVAAVKWEEQAVLRAQVQVVQAVLEAKSEVVMMTVMMMTRTSAERPAKVHHQSQWWPAKSHARRPQVTLQLTGSCQFSTSLAQRENRAGPPHTGLD